MRPAFKLPRAPAAIDASQEAAQAERAVDRPAQFLLRNKSWPENRQTGRGWKAAAIAKACIENPDEREHPTRTIRELRQRLRQQRELWSKPRQVRRGAGQDEAAAPGNSHVAGKLRDEIDLPASAIRDALQRIRRQRERLSSSRPVRPDTADAGEIKPAVTPRKLPLQQRGWQGAIAITPRILPAEVRPGNQIRNRILVIAVLVIGAVAAGVYESERLVSTVAQLFAGSLLSQTGVHGTDARRRPDVSPLRTADRPAAANDRSIPSHPMPDSYGLFVVSDGQLKRLESMRMRVPDTRIALGGIITRPSPVTLPGGKLSFVAYQRDLITNAPDSASVRVIAKVKRALKFSATGKPITTLVEDTWAVRSVSVDLTVAPAPESQEMVLLRPADPEFVMSPGRYMLVYKNQAYDFAVDGTITDTAQCLERTDSQDGAVYSECRDLP